MNENTNALAEMDKLPVHTAVLKNVLPAAAIMLMSLIYNMADKVFIGMTGNDYMVAAVTLAMPVFVLFTSFGNIFGTGGVALISRFTGEGDTKKSRQTSSFCFWGAAGVGVVLMLVLWIFKSGIFNVLGASGAETIAFTSDYLIYLAVCCPFAILSQTISSLIRAAGKPTQSMIGMILGNVVNIVLDPVFILALNMGAKGAAIATLVGQMCAFGYYMVLILKGKCAVSINIKEFTVKHKIATSVFAIGTPAALLSIFQSVCNIVTNNQIAAYGDIAVAGIGAAQNIVTIIGIFAIGVGTGIQPLLGYQIGSHNKKKFLDILRFSILLAIGICLVMTLFCFLFTEGVISAFVSSEEAVSLGISFARIIMITTWLYGLFNVIAMVIQAMGRSVASLIVSMSRNCYIFIPLVLILSKTVGMYGVVWAFPISDVVCIVIAAAVLGYSIKKCFTEPCDESREHTPEATSSGKPGIVITIGRSYGAGGRSVGKAVAGQLGIPFYDKEILEMAAEKSSLSQKYLERMDETAKLTTTTGIYNVYTAYKPLQSLESMADQAQKEVVEQIAGAGSCVIVGRRAEVVLQEKTPLLRVFVTASEDERTARIAKRDHISEKAAAKKISEVDKERSEYYNGFSDMHWGQAKTYDLCVDTSALGIDGAANVILAALKEMK